MSSAPDPFPSLDKALESLYGRIPRIIKKTSLSGGDINRAALLQLDKGDRLFYKSNTRENLSFFRAEERGLEALRKVGVIGVPKPLAFGVDGKEAFLLLPYLESEKEQAGYWETFGRELALLHKKGRGTFFGFHGDNFIGATPQKNNPMPLWVDFFRERRLEFQIELAQAHIDASLSRQLLIFLDKLENYLPEPDYPSLLHGDLWGGNVLAGPDGKAWIIDPAAYYGHPEADLAMTELFGGFKNDFYRSYGEENPLEPGYGERKDIYNLYHMLNHLNLFGSSYLSSVKRIVSRYGG